MRVVKVGLLGLGTVGGGTASLLSENAKIIGQRANCKIVLAKVAALELDRAKELGLNVQLTTDAMEVVNQADCEIIVELIGGYQPALSLVLQAIKNGKHVVTANKALIAMHGEQIFKAAKERGVIVAYEAAVAGGIPIIKSIREGLSANHIQWLAGIVNGTSNFILSEMRDRGRTFSEALSEAQERGYAEANPSFDIEGIDAAHKITILATEAFGIPLRFDACYTEGIAHITAKDVIYAHELGYRIKHLGIARRTEQGIEMRVHPALIPEQRLIAHIDGVMNGVLIMADAVGPTLYYGAGAGAKPTASAVVADIIDVVRRLDGHLENRRSDLGLQREATDIALLPIDQVQSAYYLRMTASDRVGILAEVASILASFNISIEAIIQKDPAGEQQAEMIMLTHQVKEQQIDKAIVAIESLEGMDSQVIRIRVELLQ